MQSILVTDDQIIALTYNGHLQIYDRYTYQRIKKISLQTGCYQNHALTIDDKHFIFGDRKGAIHFWDRETFLRVRTMKCCDEWHEEIRSLAVGKDHIFSGGGDNLIRVWDRKIGVRLILSWGIGIRIRMCCKL